MVHPVGNLGAPWRARLRAIPGGSLSTLRDDPGETAPPERLLQAIWHQQRIQRERLRTADGRVLHVLHPGFWNREPGPDFRGAVLQFGDDPPRSVDVEVDVATAGWRAHRHDINPSFRNVGLQVVWQGDGPGESGQPLLALEPVLDAPLSALAETLAADSARALPLEFLGRCCAPLRACSPPELQGLLREAAFARWQAHAALLEARARQAGWEQSLWEGLFRALGFKHNVWPMQRLGELRRELAAAEPGSTVSAWQARLLGVAGLLPAELPAGAGRRILQELWSQWWRERDQFGAFILPHSLWRFGGVRPANHPQRRLALAAHWLAAGTLPARLEQWALAPCAPRRLQASLREVMQAGPDAFWTRHWTLGCARLARPQPLLGSARLTDLAINVVLPWLWVRAAEGGNEALRMEMEQRFLAWPAAADNAVLRLARTRLLGGRREAVVRGAAAQQGLMQIVREFCEHSNAVCAGCRFPELVRGGRDAGADSRARPAG